MAPSESALSYGLHSKAVAFHFLHPVARERAVIADLESVYLKNDTGAKFLEEAFLLGKQVNVKFEYHDKSYVTGWGSVTECSLSTPHDDVATLSGTIKGDGALSELKPAASEK